ncbi:helix-turn-helix domain-containing protein [Paenibacillus sp. 1P07SE]|uniref:helix-turn-helix domain-containing protein n=1 Tax=Paenibacillus sp. 1P07SE TaxID=3132209 RepID=UPI0039A74E7F
MNAEDAPSAGHSCHVSKMLGCIASQYQQDLSLETMADITGLHPNYISQLFKRETGVSFIHYLQEYRVEKAKEILVQHPSLSVQVVGNQVGYENPQHFMKVFKKLTGMTPGTYRGQKE